MIIFLLGWQELVLEDVDQLRLELAVGDTLPHLGDPDDRLLNPHNAQLVDAEKYGKKYFLCFKKVRTPYHNLW